MIYNNRTYLESLSKDLNKYPSVIDTLEGLNNKILLKKSYIEKLARVKSNLEAFLLSLGITFLYFYSTLFNLQQVQVQKNLIKRILLIGIELLCLPLFFIVIKEPKNSVRSKFKIVKNNNNKKREERKKE